MTTPLLLDTCVVLSLFASRRMQEILDANPGPFQVAEAVRRESLYIHVVVDGVREKEPVSLEPLLLAGTLTAVEPVTEAEFQSLLEFSLLLDDGEAMTCALALHRGFRIATDERKTTRLVGTQIPILGTLDLVRTWADTVAPSPDEILEVLVAIQDRGCIPGPSHAHRDWWDRTISGKR